MREEAPRRSRGSSVVLLLAPFAGVLLVVLAGVVLSAPRGEAREAPAPAGDRAAGAEAGVVGDPDGWGWYTEAQAERGREAYGRHCAECHSPDLRARATYISLYAYPALTGAYFWDRWGGQTVHALLLVMQETMPLHAPGSLDGETYAAIAAHVLRENGFPPGERELPPAVHDVERLVAMPIEPGHARPRARAQEVGERRAALLAEEPDAPPPEEPPVDEGPPDDEPPLPDDEDAPSRDAWFSESQVERGRAVYLESCSRCHGGAMQGGGVAPSLAGDNFLERWDGEPLSDLFFIVHELMPLDDQGSLGRHTAADLLAYILSQNGFAAGTVELPQHEERLERFVLERERARSP